MTDIVLNPITSGYNVARINANFDAIEDAINTETLHTTGGNNVMSQSIDMNSNRIYNLPAPIQGHEALRLEDLIAVDSGNSTQLRVDLANDSDPVKGAGQIGRAIQIVGTITELRGLLKTSPSKTALVLGYYASGDGGGGIYYLDAADLVSIDNGGTVIVATDGGRWKLAFKDHISLAQFGAKGDAVFDNAAIWSTAVKFCASNHVALYVPDGRFLVSTKAVVDGVTDAFAFVRIFGNGRATGPALASAPVRCGPVILTSGNGALEVWFRQFSNEALTIDGVSFYDLATPSLATVPAVKVKQGDPSGTQRYITNLNFDNIAAVGYEHVFFFQGMYPNTTHTDLDNYIGPTHFKRYYPYNCGSGITLSNCTMNRFRLSESLLFNLSLGGIIVDKAFSISDIPFAQATGGSIAGALDMVHFEGVQGCFRFREIGASFPAHVLNLTDVTRELCGVFGPGSGDPYGFVKPVILTVNGRTEKNLAFGEDSLPVLPANSEVSSEVFANFITVTAAGSVKVHTPRTINAHGLSGSIPGSSSDVVTITLSNPAEFFSMDFEIEYLAGVGGRRVVHVAGDSAFSGVSAVTGAANPVITETVTFPVAGQIQITLSNSGGAAVPYRIKTANYTGMQFTIVT